MRVVSCYHLLFMKRFSHIWILISLALLGIFLSVWVFDSYKEEKSRLEGEVKLDLAHIILESVDIDFPKIINTLQIGEYPTYFEEIESPQIKTEIHFDTLQNTQTVFRKKVFRDIDSFSFIHSNMTCPDTIYARGSQVLFATAQEGELIEDGMLRDIYPEKYQAEFDSAMADLPKKAVYGIIPQILVAIGLFGAIIFAVLMLQRNYQQKELEMEAKNQFLNNMTHELKTPVATIGIALEAIQDFAARPQKAEEYMHTSRAELKRLAKLIDQVMTASQTQHIPATYQKEVLDFPEVLQSVLTSLGPQIEEQKANVSVIMPEIGASMLGDVEHISNMLRNLLDNSLKYSKKGVEIQLKAKIAGDKLHFHISDNGIGIPERFQKKVFDQFFRVPTGNIHTVKGYGMGLNYVAQVVKSHEGKIQLNSQEQSGTEIHLRFPLYRG